MTTSSASKSPSSPLVTLIAPTTMQTSVTSSTSSMSTPLVSTVSSASPNNNNNNNKHVSVKCENSYGNNSNTSCNNEGTNSQALDDNGHKIIMKSNGRSGGSGTCKMVNISTNHERDSSGSGSLSTAIRQSATNISNCSIQYRESSPSNTANRLDLSNNSNTTLQKKTENISTDEEKKKIIQEKNHEKANNSTSSTTSISTITTNTNFAPLSSTTTNSLTTSASCTSKNLNSAEEDKDVAIKEEHNISPNMSPVGFSCSIDQGSHALIPESSVSNANLNEATNDKNDSKAHILPIIGTNSNANGNSIEESNTNNSHNNPTSTISGHNASHTYNSNTNAMISLNSGNSGGNCVDYMQHQNHIFVFSTQLANKSADAVLNGQFPTIIAYHCTQPSTKSFLEDFFLKNSMKMTKLQRQNTLNMCNMSIGNSGELLGGQLWLNTLSKMPQKLSANKNGDECDILSWDQTHSDIDLSSGGDRNSINNLENSEIVRNSGANNKSLAVNELDSNNIPSLQGTKVPDENLTPQQRQHRVEQLAKLKKIGLNLFPENDSTEFRSEISTGQTRKMPVDKIGGAATNPMIQMATTNSPSCNNISSGNKNSVHNNNVMKTEGMSALVDAVSSMSSDIIGPNELSMLPQYSSNKAPSNVHQSNHISDTLTNSMGININNILPNLSSSSPLSNIPAAPMTNMANNSLTKTSTIGNMHNSTMGSASANSTAINDENSGCNSINADVNAGFGQNFSTVVGETNNILECDVNLKHIAVGNNDNQGGGATSETGNLAQMEWSTLQQQFYGERLKSNVSDGACNVVPLSATRTNPTSINLNARSNNTLNVSTASSNLNTHRSIQGPPPPYHQTTANQRPASVPITSQSPNPASPNNPTSNLSLPSPRTSSIMGMTNNSPNTDSTAAAAVAISSSSSAPNSVAIAVVLGSGSGGGSGCVSSNCVNNITKVSFSQDGSPSNNQTSNLITGGGNKICNRSNNAAALSNYTNAEVSPKDLDTSNSTTSTTDISKIESTFANSGVISSGGMGSSAGSNSNAGNSFKNQSTSLERQNAVQMASQFSRRTDNIPLNPNNNRMLQNKMVNSFDPISSLAQMSQQLTGCVGGLGNSPNNMGILGSAGSAGGINEMSSGINMDGTMGPMDPSMDHCATSGGGNIGIAVTGCGGSSTISFAPNNCHIMGPMPQRLINSKMCGPGGDISGFNGSVMGIKGEHPTFSGIMPTVRMANHHRMSSNFGSFNMAPNIQVKASTPNTIQYLPVRTQSNSTNNIRVPPSLEFLQRYTNPQLMGAALGGGPTPCSMDNSSIGNPMASPSEMSKLSSANSNMGLNMNQENFFGSCHSLNSMSSLADQDELQGVGSAIVGGNNNNVGNSGIISSHDIQMGPQGTLLRGLRPMRQTCINQGGGGLVPTSPRMQHPIMGGGKRPPSSGPTPMLSFNSNGTDSMDIADQTPPIFNSTVLNNSPGSVQVYQQKGSNKLVRDNGASLNSANNNGNSGPQNGLLSSDVASLQSSVLPGSIGGGRTGLNNSNILSNSLNMNGSIISSGCAPSSPLNYKPFVGPASNDIKYAQQFHSFQQQLYATSVRGQQPGNVSNALHTNNSNSNAGFFVNK